MAVYRMTIDFDFGEDVSLDTLVDYDFKDFINQVDATLSSAHLDDKVSWSIKECNKTDE
jgi:hypothetical protein